MRNSGLMSSQESPPTYTNVALDAICTRLLRTYSDIHFASKLLVISSWSSIEHVLAFA